MGGPPLNGGRSKPSRLPNGGEVIFTRSFYLMQTDKFSSILHVHGMVVSSNGGEVVSTRTYGLHSYSPSLYKQSTTIERSSMSSQNSLPSSILGLSREMSMVTTVDSKPMVIIHYRHWFGV